MKNRPSLCLVVASLLVAALAVSQARADVTLPKVIDSHMVLERDKPLPIWGWASPGEEVTVKLDDATATAKADAAGNWQVTPMHAKGAPQTLPAQHGWPAVPQATQLPEEQMVSPMQVLPAQQM